MALQTQNALNVFREQLQCTSRSRYGFMATGRSALSHRLQAPNAEPRSWSCRHSRRQLSRRCVACCSQKDRKGATPGPDNTTNLLALGALVLAGAATYGYPLVADNVEDFLYSVDALTAPNGFGLADLLAGLLWGTSLYFASPLQQLLLFIGRIETQRPSDWLILLLARRLLGMRIRDVNEAPGWLAPLAAAVCLASGLGISFTLQATLGDSTWALSTGLGACMAAGVYELGRPARFSRKEAEQVDRQWRDFVAFADARLQRSGRCHESEVATAFRRQQPAYRSPDTLPDPLLRSMIRNWHPGADRTPNGYYRNLSLVARV
ncbi:hypothetical protein Agub_g3620, partial [Astrephomene gubernaculifera]